MRDRVGPLSCLLLVLLGLAAAAGQEATPSLLDPVIEMLEQDQLAPAESELRRILAQADDPLARYLLGVVLSRQARFDEAEGEFIQALATQPDLLPARQHLVRLYLTRNREADALTELRRAARLGPLDRDLALQLAFAELGEGNTAAAEEQLRSLVERFGSVQALVRLARISASREDPEAALDFLRQAQETAPNSEEVLSAYGRISLTSGAPVPAILALEPLLRMHPTVPEYAYLLGVARMQVGDMGGAVEALEQAVELEPNRALNLIALGMALNHQKRYAEARELLTESLRLEPDSARAIASLAEAYEGLGAVDEAERHARRALAQGGADGTAHLVIGMVRMKQARYAEAREALEQAVAADPESAKAHYQLSLAYARLGDRESSRRHLEISRQVRQEIEERLMELRRRVGAETGGMSR